MFLVVPHGLAPRVGGKSFPFVSVLVACTVVAAFIGERYFLYLPAYAQDVVGLLAHARLYSDPEAALFAPWQLWSHALIQADWWALLANVVVWLWLAPALERRLGSVLFLALAAVAVPAGAAVFVFAKEAVNDLGLSLVLCWLFGATLAHQPQARIGLRCWWWLLARVGEIRVWLPVAVLIAAYAVSEMTRLFAGDVAAQTGVWQRFMPVYVMAHAIVLVLGQLSVRLCLWWEHAAQTAAGFPNR